MSEENKTIETIEETKAQLLARIEVLNAELEDIQDKERKEKANSLEAVVNRLIEKRIAVFEEEINGYGWFDDKLEDSDIDDKIRRVVNDTIEDWEIDADISLRKY